MFGGSVFYVASVSRFSVFRFTSPVLPYLQPMKRFLLYLMAVLYIAAGVNHFWHTAMYQSIMPPYLPWPLQLVYISGVFEILFGLLLLPKPTRRLAAAGIIFLLVAVFPANVQMAVNYAREHNPHLWVAILRLPLQGVLVWWAWGYYNVKRQT